MWLSDSYDIPQDVVEGPHSPAFREFLLTWFGSTSRITFGLPDLTVLNDLTLEETALAQELVRRNLKCRYTHIINATWALRDTSAAPILREMLQDEPDESRRLSIAGALWKLVRDPVFIECLERAKESGLIASYPHLRQVLWLDGAQAVDFLIDLLPASDDSKFWLILQRLSRLRFFHADVMAMIREHNRAKGAGFEALGLLNELESGRVVPLFELRPPFYYRNHRGDQAFFELMTAAVRKWNLTRHRTLGSY